MAGDERSRDEHDPGSSPEDAADPVLKAKYLDYCSARLSEVFVSLSDERIYELVEEAAEEGRVDVTELGFDEMVRLVTEKLQRSVPLPDFRTWAREYRENPDRYEPYLMGLWERSTGEGDAEEAAADGDDGEGGDAGEGPPGGEDRPPGRGGTTDR